MNEQEISQLLEICLTRLETGEGLDSILADYPQAQTELRALLQAAEWAQLPAQIPPPTPQQANRQRARFLARAAELRSPARQRQPLFGFLSRLRALPAVLMLVVVLASGLLGVGIASASALPGDALYPLKLQIESAESALTASSGQPAWESRLAQRRYDEVVALLRLGREADVTFFGYLARTDQGWQIGEIQLDFPPELALPLDAMQNAYVRVDGKTGSSGRVLVNRLRFELVEVAGRIDSLSPTRWQVKGIPLVFTPRTYIQGIPQVGSLVNVQAVRFVDGQLEALLVEVVVEQSPAATETMLPVISSETEDTPEVEKTEETEKGDSGNEGQDDEKTPDSDSSGSGSSGKSATRTPEPDDTDTPDGANEADDTPDPSKTPDD